MTAIKTTNELNPIFLQSLRAVKVAEWKVNEFNGEIKKDDQGRPMYRGDALQALRVKDGQIAGAVFGQVSINVLTPIELAPMSLYTPVGVYVWNDYDARKTSITIDSLAPVK